VQCEARLWRTGARHPRLRRTRGPTSNAAVDEEHTMRASAADNGGSACRGAAFRPDRWWAADSAIAREHCRPNRDRQLRLHLPAGTTAPASTALATLKLVTRPRTGSGASTISGHALSTAVLRRHRTSPLPRCHLAPTAASDQIEPQDNYRSAAMALVQWKSVTRPMRRPKPPGRVRRTHHQSFRAHLARVHHLQATTRGRPGRGAVTPPATLPTYAFEEDHQPDAAT
jgi:hypothetical protein